MRRRAPSSSEESPGASGNPGPRFPVATRSTSAPPAGRSPVEGPFFVDTNVLVYHRDSSDPERQARAAEWMARLWDEGSGRVSVQVLHEYYVTVTGKLDPGMPREEAREDIAALRAWNPLAPDAGLLEDAWAVEDRYRLSFWDAMIVAAAHRLDCRTLLTEDLQDGQDLDGLLVRSPFTLDP